METKWPFFANSGHALQVLGMHHVWMRSSTACSTPQSQLILAAFCNYIKRRSIRKPVWVNFTKAAVRSPVSSRADKVEGLVEQAYLYSKSTPWQNTLFSLRKFSICSTRTHAKKERKKKRKKKVIHWKEITQTKAGIKKSHSDASWTNNNLHLHYVHVHTTCTKQFGTVWCTLGCVHVSILLCETAVFFYAEKEKEKENLEQKMLSHHSLQFPRHWDNREAAYQYTWT